MTQTLVINVVAFRESCSGACDFCWRRTRNDRKWGVAESDSVFEGVRMCDGCIFLCEERPPFFRSLLRARFRELPGEGYAFHRELLRSILEGYLEVRVKHLLPYSEPLQQLC